MSTRPEIQPLPRTAPVPATGRRVAAIAIGAALVAAAAQVEIPIPLTVVPMTLQDLAVLAVGGLLGPAAGAAALVTYLTTGALGLPVFAGGGAGFLHLMGPTGGYLLAFPVAAAVMGALVGPTPRFVRALGAAGVAMAVVHIGGIAQLAVLTGDLEAAVRLGSVPFLGVSTLKAGLAAALVAGVHPTVSKLL
ncbi:MAG TPA: biotin transporter BioY [Gemmatimonadales bacterium]|nr:biotin transporter BioY [Gemmatimonadales bacterium]